MLEAVRLALRIATQAFDTEIGALIDDCLSELRLLGVYRDSLAADPQIKSAVIFYCKANFGNNPDAAHWAEVYARKVSQLIIAAGYGANGRELPAPEVENG